MLGLLNYITWDVSPFIYEGEHFAIGWYGTLWTLGLLGMLITLLVTFKHDGVPSQFALITFMVSLVCVIFFGHLFQGLFYEWYYSPADPWYFLGREWDYRNHYFDHPMMFLTFNHGGFASHGCIFGGLLTAMLLAKPFKCSLWWLSDRIMTGLLFLAVCVRFGNFFNGEIYGIPTDLPWGVVFKEGEPPCHPTMFYEITYILVFYILLLLIIESKKLHKYNGMATAIGFMSVLCRMLIEIIKNPQMTIESSWYLDMGQWLSIPYLLGGIYLLYYVVNQDSPQNMPPSLQSYGLKRKSGTHKK